MRSDPSILRTLRWASPNWGTIMRERRQEKIGWVGGWLGGFVWVLFLSVILFVRGQTLPAS